MWSAVEALDGSIGIPRWSPSSLRARHYFNCGQGELDILHAVSGDIGKEIVPHHLLNRMGASCSWSWTW